MAKTNGKTQKPIVGRVVATARKQMQAAKTKAQKAKAKAQEVKAKAQAAKAKVQAAKEKAQAAKKRVRESEIVRKIQEPSYAGTVIDTMWGDPDYCETVMQDWAGATFPSVPKRARVPKPSLSAPPTNLVHTNGASIPAQRRARKAAARKRIQTPEDTLVAPPGWL